MEVNVCNVNYVLKDTHINKNFKVALPSKLDQSIKQIIKKNGFLKHIVEKQNISTNNGNYLGVLYTIDIKGETKNGHKEINIFVKSIKSKDDTIKIISISDVYKTETFAYKELFRIYEELQEDANIPLERRFKMVKGYEETSAEAIIMENVSQSGYKMCNRMHVPSLQFARLSVQALAKFHGLSFVLKEKRPKYFETKIKTIDNPFIYKEAWPPFVESMKNMTMEFIDEEYKVRVEKIYAEIVVSLPRYYNDESTKVCLCHGDYGQNNILTKLDNDQEKEVIAVDYQLMYYGCPISDFFYFIYFCTDRNFRKNHLSELKEYYYEELSDFLTYFDLNIESVYPRKDFERAYKEKLDYGLMISLLYLAFMFVSEDGKPDVIGLNFHVDDRFKERIRGVLEDYEEWGYL